MKKGIALFSTLLILVLVIMLMSIALKNSTNIKKSMLQDRYIIQENLTVTDIIKFVGDKIVNKIPTDPTQRAYTLNTLFSSPMSFKDPISNSTITVSLLSNDNKLNINYIVGDAGEKLVLQLFETLGVKEPNVLRDILLANIQNSDKYQDNYKIPLKNLNTAFGFIKSKKQFDSMLDLYVEYSDDIEVYGIDFQKVFHFEYNSGIQYNRAASNKLDINYVAIEILDTQVSLSAEIRKQLKEKTFIFSDFSELNLRQDNDVDEPQKLKDYGFGFDTENIILDINIKSINNRVNYQLIYNLKSKKISNISMDRWIY